MSCAGEEEERRSVVEKLVREFVRRDGRVPAAHFIEVRRTGNTQLELLVNPELPSRE